jgi:MFS family permease
VSSPSSAQRFQLAALFFIVGHALGLWNINLSSVLTEYGYGQWVIDSVWSTGAIASIISPLIVGALADQRFSSERVLRWLGLGAATCLCLLFAGIYFRWHWGFILLVAQLHALWSAPSFGLATSLVISRLGNAKMEFGPVRAWATIGWMLAGPVVSYVLLADHHVRSGFAAAAMWLVAVAFTFTFKPVPPPEQKTHRSWRDILGLDAWSLLKHPDHRVVFVGAALLNIPLAAFYPHTPLHLHDLGVERFHVFGVQLHPTALMSTAQLTEAIGLFALSWVLSAMRLKWLFLAGIGAGVLRYALCAMNTVPTVTLGILMHGVCFTLFYMTAQIYLEQRIAVEMRARAQALLSLMMSGIGNFIGYQGCGWWRRIHVSGGHTDWPVYWTGLSCVIALIFVWFAVSYRGRYRV